MVAGARIEVALGSNCSAPSGNVTMEVMATPAKVSGTCTRSHGTSGVGSPPSRCQSGIQSGAVDDAVDRRFISSALATELGVVGITKPRSAMLAVVTRRTSPPTRRADTSDPSTRTRSVSVGAAGSDTSTKATVRYDVLAWVADGSPSTGSETSVSEPNTTARPSATSSSLTLAHPSSGLRSPVGSGSRAAGSTATVDTTSRVLASVMRRFPLPSRS